MRPQTRRRTIVGTGIVAALALVGTVSWLAVPGGRPTSGTSGGTSTPQGSSTAPPSTIPGGAAGVALGVYVKPDPSVGDAEATLRRFETTIDRHLAIVQTFTGWEDPSGAMIPFPTAFATTASSLGATPMITWQPEQAVDAAQAGGALSDQPDFSLAELASGRYDAYIRSWALEARSFGKPVYVRMMHEMNDRTYPWSIGVNGNSSAQGYITAWRHIVDIFRSAGAGNVEFVSCVGAQPASPDPTLYFPGDGYVSWIAIDGYNRGTPWQSFTSIFTGSYRELTAVSTRPVMIAETGTVEQPGDPSAKAAWIMSAFEHEIPDGFPRVRAVLYFDAPGRGFSFALTSSGGGTPVLPPGRPRAGAPGDGPRLDPSTYPVDLIPSTPVASGAPVIPVDGRPPTARCQTPPMTPRAPGSPRAHPPRHAHVRTSATGSSRVLALDGLRAFALLIIMGYHFGVGWLQGGFFSLDIFYVLSGYLITGLLLGEWARAARIPLGAFWLRRARRLLPALLVALVGGHPDC